MSAVLAKKAVELIEKGEDERLMRLRLFRANACMKHGLPFEDDATKKKEETTVTELGIIDRVVDRLIDKINPPRDGQNGADGKDGKDGEDGHDGLSPDPQEIADLVLQQMPKFDPAKIAADVASKVDVSRIANYAATLVPKVDEQGIADAVASKIPKPDVNKIVADITARVNRNGGNKQLGVKDLAKLLAVSALSAGAVAGPLIYFTRPDPVIIEKPVEPKTGSVLQYLEDSGFSVGDEGPEAR